MKRKINKGSSNASELTDFELGVMHAVVLIQMLHDNSVIATDVLIEAGLSSADCTSFDDYDKEALRTLDLNRVNIKGLHS